MIVDAVQTLTVASLSSSGAVLLALLLRKPLRDRFGAASAYAIWTILPLSITVVLVPAPVAHEMLPAVIAGTVPSMLPLGAANIAGAAMFDWHPWLIVAWLFGTLCCAVILGQRQRRYVRALGTLSPIGGQVLRAESSAGSPALLGAWRPRIVLPADFETRFTAAERALILAHERIHRKRGDAQANWLAAALRCVFWFNPLIHFAASRFRFDQELACDANVIARFPQARRAYAGAMLKTQLPDAPRLELGLAVGCYWQASHPLAERISLLKKPLPSRTRHMAGYVAAASVAIMGSYAAWAARPASAAAVAFSGPVNPIRAELVFSIDSTPLDGSWSSASDNFAYMIHDSAASPSLWRVGLREHEPFNIAVMRSGERWDFGGTPSPNADGTLDLDGIVKHDNAIVGRPHLIVRDGEPAAIQVGDQAAGGFRGFGVQMTLARIEAPADSPRKPQANAAIAGGDRTASYRSMRRIAYPPAALAAGAEGIVYVTAHIGRDGSVESASAKAASDNANAMSDLTAAAIAGVRTWTFIPAEHDGAAVASVEIIPLVFSMRADPALQPTAGTLDAVRVGPPDEPRAASADHPPSEDTTFREMHPPKYPAAAVLEKQSGKLQFKVLVDEHGTPQTIEVESSDPPEAARIFAQASIEAIMQWRFNPGIKNGHAEGGWILVPIDYTLTDE